MRGILSVFVVLCAALGAWAQLSWPIGFALMGAAAKARVVATTEQGFADWPLMTNVAWTSSNGWQVTSGTRVKNDGGTNTTPGYVELISNATNVWLTLPFQNRGIAYFSYWYKRSLAASVTNNFELQRSTDAVTWTRIGTLPTNFTTSAQQFTTNLNLAGRAQFRVGWSNVVAGSGGQGRLDDFLFTTRTFP